MKNKNKNKTKKNIKILHPDFDKVDPNKFPDNLTDEAKGEWIIIAPLAKKLGFLNTSNLDLWVGLCNVLYNYKNSLVVLEDSRLLGRPRKEISFYEKMRDEHAKCAARMLDEMSLNPQELDIPYAIFKKQKKLIFRGTLIRTG